MDAGAKELLHEIGLDLREGAEAPVTIDGVAFRAVSEVRVLAPRDGAMQVQVTFLAKSIGGIEASAKPAAREEQPAPPGPPRPVTNGG